MRILLLLTLVTFTTHAFADVLLEPYLTYVEGTVSGSQTISAAGQTVSGSAKDNEHGVGFGGRLGFSMTGLLFGADYFSAKPESGGSSSPLTDIGVFAGYQFPMFTASVTYIVSSKIVGIQQSDVNGVDHETDVKGTGYKATLGFSILPLLSLNFIYFAHTWNKADLLPYVTELKIEDSGGMVGLSVPFTF